MALAILLAIGSPSLADAVKLGNRIVKDVTIVGLREGKLYYKTSSGQNKNALLAEVQGIELDKHPELAKGNDAFAKGDFAAAAKLLGSVVDAAKDDYVKIIAGAQLVAALDRDGKFLEAARRYATLLALDNGPLTQQARPQNMPADAEGRAKASDTLASDLKTAKDPIARDFLSKTIAQLKSGEAPPPPPATDNATLPAPRSGLLNTAAENAKDPIDVLIEQGKADQALASVEQSLKAGQGGSVPRLLYQRGRALAALGKDEDALLSYMRVIIHFTPKTCAQYDKCLVDAGKLFAKKGQPRHARELWTEALAQYDPESPQAKSLDGLLKELKD